MKRIIIAAIAGAALMLVGNYGVRAQGTVYVNNYDSGVGLFQGNLTTGAPMGTFVQILSGPDASSLTPLTPAGLSSSIMTITDSSAAGGFFDQGYGASSIAAAGSGWLQLIAWNGAATYAQAQALPGAFVGSSAPWQQLVGTAIPAPPNLPTPVALAIPGTSVLLTVVAVPEPSTIVLAGLGLASMLMLRRRK